MNKKITFSLLILLLVLSGCSKTEKTESGSKTTENKIVTEDVKYIEDNSEITVHRNKLTKSATVDVLFKIKDSEEYADFLGNKLALVPLLFNLSCSTFTMALFEPEKLVETMGTGTVNIDPKMRGDLTGYTPKKVSLKFIDAEDGQNIGSCESERAGIQNIKTEITRSYDGVDSFMGVKMGVFSDSK